MSTASALFVTSAPMRRPPSAVSSDIGERQHADIDEMRRRLDLQLHEIDEVGATSYELGRRLACCRCAG
jgi:hypothetical protein